MSYLVFRRSLLSDDAIQEDEREEGRARDEIEHALRLSYDIACGPSSVLSAYPNRVRVLRADASPHLRGEYNKVFEIAMRLLADLRIETAAAVGIAAEAIIQERELCAKVCEDRGLHEAAAAIRNIDK